MKKTPFLFIVPLLLAAGNNKAQTMNSVRFSAERVSKTATITVNGTIEQVFILFGAFEERKWANGWNPELIFPATETMGEGTTFRTRGHGHGEAAFLWIVSKYEIEKHLVQYLVSTENRYWTITIQCTPGAGNKTLATVTYTFTGLNESGNEINHHSLAAMYHENLADWQEEINYYLANGKLKLRE